MDIKIIDSGWLSSARTGTQQTTANRVNSGNSMTLKSPGLSLKGKGLNNVDPIPASFANAPVNVNGFENDRLSIELIIDKSASGEYGDLVELNRLHKTKGVKLLYPSSLTDTTKGIIELLGSTSTNFSGNEVGASTPCLMGYVDSVSINDSANTSKFRITISFVVTG